MICEIEVGARRCDTNSISVGPDDALPLNGESEVPLGSSAKSPVRGVGASLSKLIRLSKNNRRLTAQPAWSG